MGRKNGKEREKERDRKEKQKGGTTKKTANTQTNEEAAGRGTAPTLSHATRREDNSVTGRGSAPTLAHAARNARKRSSGRKGGRPQLGRIGFQLI